MRKNAAVRLLILAVLVLLVLSGCPMVLDTSLLQAVRDMVNAAAASAATPVVSGTTPTSDTTPTWTWTIPSGAVEFRYQVDGEAEGAWTMVGGGVDTYTPSSPLALGAHTLFVQAGSSAGKWSASGGFEITIVIGVPANLNASDGTSTSQVNLSWDIVEGATSYYFYSSTSDTPPASEVGTTTGTTSNDTAAVPGQLYYYWVRALGAAGLGEYSASTSGYRGLGSTSISNTSNGSSTAYIEITFGAVTGATSYQLYRSTDTTPPIGSTTPTIIDVPSSPYQDTSAPPGSYQYYWVRAAASSSSSTGAWSAISDSGYRKLSPPVLSLVPYEDNGFVNLDWPVVTGATEYVIERRSYPSGFFSVISTVGSAQTWYEDHPGNLAWWEYRVFANSPVGYSDSSNLIQIYTNIAG